MKVVVRSTLRSTTHSPANRARARELAWRWVRSNWPRLVPSSSEMERSDFERALPGQELMVQTNDDRSVWSLSVAHTHRASARSWMTQVQVTDTGTADTLGLQTACTEVPDAPLVAPPRLLSDWVESLDLEDAGLAVRGTAREVFDKWHFEALCEHVLAKERKLPVIALVNRPQSRYYGVDPQGLAENLRGMAHVACVAPHLCDDIEHRLGHSFRVEHGAARIYAAGFNVNADPRAHPLIKDSSSTDGTQPKDPASFRRLLRKKICALSVGDV
jgi:hypothetical protein